MNTHISAPTGMEPFAFSYDEHGLVSVDSDREPHPKPKRYRHAFKLFKKAGGGFILEITFNDEEDVRHCFVKDCQTLDEACRELSCYDPIDQIPDEPPTVRDQLRHRYEARHEHFLVQVIRRFVQKPEPEQAAGRC
jgi:hypothetical protein